MLLTFKEAVSNPEKKWIKTIREEKESLRENNIPGMYLTFVN